jgi:glycosyltransferase involved in cell wall biosynthesis
VVTPRYGPDIGGGAEELGRWAAQWLAVRHDVTVLTTCALDYSTWRDHYPPGEQTVNGVRVLRFRVPVPRDPERFNTWYGWLNGTPTDVGGGERWMREQGPNAPELLEHLDRRGGAYDAVLFVPYLYATTYDGLPLVSDRSVLIPALHDEPPARFRIMERTFALARGLAFSTPEERDFCDLRFGRSEAIRALIGVGVTEPPEAAPTCGDPYVLYLGRVDYSKGCADLLAHHEAAFGADRAAPRLIMAGRVAMDVPRRSWLTVLGFVDEEEKHALLAGAIAVIMPSPYESLSMVVLEAWTHARPVIVSERSPVLVGQVRRAGGGLWYADAPEYARALAEVSGSPWVAASLGRQGRRYARGRFGQEAAGRRLEALVTAVAAPEDAGP